MKPDLLYIIHRERLIPLAEKFANEKCGGKSSSKKLKIKYAWSEKWNLAFHNMMNELWQAKKHKGEYLK